MTGIKDIRDDFENLFTDEELVRIYETLFEAEEYERKMQRKEKKHESS